MSLRYISTAIRFENVEDPWRSMERSVVQNTTCYTLSQPFNMLLLNVTNHPQVLYPGSNSR
eukprot:31623-Pyramimonas_sp.AAC.2